MGIFGLTQETLILNAFSFFLSQLKLDSDRVAADPELSGFADCFPLRWKLLRTVVSNRLRFVEVITDDVDDANAIFESLNAKGRNLEQIDLLKNYLFLLLHDDDRVLQQFWTPLTTSWRQHRLQASVGDLVSRVVSAPQSKLYPTKQQELQQANAGLETVFDELTRLRAEAKNYLLMMDPSGSHDESLREGLVDMQRAGVMTLPLVLYLMRYGGHQEGGFPVGMSGTEAHRVIPDSTILRRETLCKSTLNSYFSTMLGEAHSGENELGLGRRRPSGSRRQDPRRCLRTGRRMTGLRPHWPACRSTPTVRAHSACLSSNGWTRPMVSSIRSTTLKPTSPSSTPGFSSRQ